jgi:signal transduction histidine kinase
VLFNCFENALRHGGGVSRIEISFVEKDTCGELVVADDGVGIPFGQKKIIFARGIGQHTGFGLFLAKEVLDLTGIGISEQGTPGEGARFVLSVPKGVYRLGNP